MKIVNIKQFLRYCMLVSLLTVLQTFSYSQVKYAPMSVSTEDDICDQGVGSAQLNGATAEHETYCEIKWTINKGFLGLGGSETRYGRSISGLKGGWYGKVEVRPYNCPEALIYKSSFKIGKGDCSLNVSLDVSTNSVPCNPPSADITAYVSGGTPPYKYSWGPTNRITVSSSGTVVCIATDSLGVSGRGEVTVKLKQLECAVDPNEIKGPNGYGDDKMVSGDDMMSYTISFENDPDFATAPASRVEIEYPIPDKQKLSSFRLTDFGFGQFVFTVPSNTNSYYQRLDLADSLGVWVDVTAGIDIVNDRAYWIFQSIDPTTGFEPQSAAIGFLPVNDGDGNGEGYVSFYIVPTDNVATGDTVAAEATIVFDDNAPISTNIWVNKFDAGFPVSRITDVVLSPDDTTSCTISFTAQDDANGSGINSIELFVSSNNEQYVSAGSFDYGTDATYVMTGGSVYQFMSVATDNVGNVEDFKNIPDTTISFNAPPADILLSDELFYENSAMGTVIGELTTVDNGDLFVYELVEGEGSNDNDLFSINGNDLVVHSNFNCSNQLSYQVRIKSIDVGGLSVEKSFELTMIETNPSYDLSFSGVTCQDEHFTQYGWDIDVSDSVPGSHVYRKELQTVLGCDSICTLVLTVNPSYTFSYVDTITVGDSYYEHGFDIPNPTTGTHHYTQTFETTQGCDSIISLDLVVRNIYYTHHHELFSGWNWYSTYIDITGADGLQYIEQQLGDKAQNIKTQTNFLIQQLDMWFGGIDSLTATDMVMIQMSSNHELVLEGTAINPANIPFVVSPGWTWMSYPLTDSISVSTALAGLNSHDGDIIKSQENFAQYYNVLGWLGDLNTMMPGYGYIYRNNGTEPDTFLYNHTRHNIELNENISIASNNWVPDIHYFQDNMNIILVVDMDGQELMSENYEIGAFSADGIRGSARPLFIEQLNRYIAFLTIHGKNDDGLFFMLYDVNEDKRIATMAAETMTFVKDDVKGSVTEPFVLHFSTLTDVDEQNQDLLAIYPNPTNSNVTVDCPDIKSITVTSSLGIDVLRVTEIHSDKYIVDIKGFAAGVYYFTVKTSNGIYVKKVIKTR